MISELAAWHRDIHPFVKRLRLLQINLKPLSWMVSSLVNEPLGISTTAVI